MKVESGKWKVKESLRDILKYGLNIRIPKIKWRVPFFHVLKSSRSDTITFNFQFSTFNLSEATNSNLSFCWIQISIFGIFSIAVPLPSHKPERENAVIAGRCYESAMTALFQLTVDRRGTFFLSRAILEHNPPMKGECLWGIWMCPGSGRCGSG